MACLCAPTSHEGSFRCRLHRAPNPLSNPAHSSPNHPIRAPNYSTNRCYDVTSNQIGTHITVCESSTAMAPRPFDDRVHTAQVAADLQNRILRACPSSSSSSDSLASSSSPWSSTSLKSPSYRLLSSSSASFALTSSSSSALASSRAAASSSSPSPSSPFPCARPPPAKRPPSSYASQSKSPYRITTAPAPSPWCGSASSTTPSASHAAALAIMKQHSHNKHGARTHNRNMLSPASAFKIGPSRLSRMAVACADELPLLKEENISNSLRHGSAPDMFPDMFPGSFADTPNASGFAPFRAAQIGLKTGSPANKFKQSESLCRIVGSNEGSLIMPTVY